MSSPIARFTGFFDRLDLPSDARRTFRFHLTYAVLDGAAGGILLLAPLIALKTMGAQNWHLPLREVYGAVGTLATLYLGSWMARRRKMPFVFVPGLLSGLCAAAMTLAMNDAYWFLTFFGLGAMFEVVTRPAIAAIVRQSYPVAQRGHVTGRVRQWSSISFAVSILTAAVLLNRAGAQAKIAAQILIALAALLGLLSFLCFRRISVRDDLAGPQPSLQLKIIDSVREAVGVVIRNARYRRCLIGCFIENFSGMLYLPLIWAYLNNPLGFGYLGCAALMHAIPAIVAFATTGWVGRRIDHSSPWVCWGWIRFAWGSDALLLAATPLVAGGLTPWVLLLPLLGRIIRGSVQGGLWILWWQIGVTHFAPPGDDTSRYLGIMVFTQGVSRLLAALAAIALTAASAQPCDLLMIGGVGVILSGVYSLWQADRERRERQPRTITEFESQFSSPLARR